MQLSPQIASSLLPVQTNRMDNSNQPADLVYQTVTIAAMLLLLGSLWLF
jgi:hypothetical protein